MEITKLRSQLFSVLERVAVPLQAAWSTLARLGRGVAEKLHAARCAGVNNLRKLQLSFHEVVAVINGKIERFRSQLFSVLRQVAVYVQKLLSAPVMLGKKVADTRRRLREARLARQNDLWTLLTSSPDPVIVTNSNLRLVAANSHGLNLFGVSELNMSQFTIGTFLSHGQFLQFDRNRSPFVRPEERHGKCKIRRLDGTSWVAECIFVANVVPHQNLYRFQHCREERPRHHHRQA